MMNVYQAIEEMRRLSARGGSFSFSHMSYSIARRSSRGIVAVRRARLCRRTTKSRNRYSEYMLDYIDLDTGERATFWQPLLLTFNDNDLALT